jgi:hypothetical protein
MKFDGITGQASTLYAGDVNSIAVHPDGTIFAILGGSTPSVIGIDSATGAQKFSLPIQFAADFFEWGEIPPIIAGDGYAYMPYVDYALSACTLRVLRVDSSGASENIRIGAWPYYPSDNPNGLWQLNVDLLGMITNADKGVMFTYDVNYYGPGYGNVHHVESSIAITTGTSASVVSREGPAKSAFFPILQEADGSFVSEGYDSNGVWRAIALDQAGGVRWIGPDNYLPWIATEDGGVIAELRGGGSAVILDQNGNATGWTGSLPTQSWTGNQYAQGPSLESVVAPLVFEDGASFWPTLWGNPSGNGTAIVQCPCLLQSTGVASQSLGTSAAAASSWVTRRAYSPANQKTYLVMAGDPGRNWGPGHMWNQGQLFNLAAATLELSLSQSGNRIIDARVSSFSDFAAALTANGLIDGGVTFFGHGGIDRHGNMALFPGQDAGDANNVSILNVGSLSNGNLGPNASITLNACHAGLGGRMSIAQLIANQLRRTVLAYPVDMYFSSDPTPRRFQKVMVSPSAMPVYMVPNGDGIQPILFLPH